MTPREYLIQTIESLWPVDSEYPDTAAVGRVLHQMAIEREAPAQLDWREQPYNILREYARLCANKEFAYDEKGEDFNAWYQELKKYEAEGTDERPKCEFTPYTVSQWTVSAEGAFGGVPLFYVPSKIVNELARVYEKAGYQIIFKQ